MAENSAIEWTDHTFNPWVGCTKVGPGCDHCYAEGWAKRGGKAAGVTWGGERRRTSDSNWRQPLKWNAQAQREGRRFRVFCASLADVFDNQVPASWRAHLFALIEQTPHLDWLLLTKRIGNVMPMLSEVAHSLFWMDRLEAPGLPENVWLGATVVNQEEADRDIPKLLAVPARVRFLSIEPMLGPIDLQRSCTIRCPNGDCQPHSSGHRVVVDSESGGTLIECFCSRLNGLHWVIFGGESGPKARPMHPDWARSLRDQCTAAGVPFLFKQWGEWLPGENEAHPTAKEPDGSLRRIAHHQDGRWGATETRPTEANYVTWDEAGEMRRGPWDGRPNVTCWAERVGKRAAGRLLDGAEHNGFPT